MNSAKYEGDILFQTYKMYLKKLTKKILSNKTHWIRGFLIGLVISIIVSVLAYLGHFRIYENPVTSVLQKTLGKKSSDIVLLFITKDEYKTGFKRTSPLSRKRIAATVDVLVKLNAKVIALDIDFSDKTNDNNYLLEAIKNASSKKIPIVIPSILKPIHDLDLKQEGLSHIHPYLPENFKTNNEGFTLFKTSSLQKELTDIAIQGGTAFSLDRDGIFRNAKAFYYTSQNTSYKIIPSFPLAISASYLGITEDNLNYAIEKKHNHNIRLVIPSNKKPDNELNIHYGSKGKISPNFIGNYEHFERVIDLHTLLDVYGGDAPGGKTIIDNKIVIVGGVYDKNDFYITPVGRMSGMEIIANITQNIINRDLISHLSFWKAFIFEVMLGAVVALFFILFSPIKAALVCFITLIPLVTISSLIAFSSTYYWFDFIPTIAGVMLHGIISKIEETAHKKKELLINNISTF